MIDKIVSLSIVALLLASCTAPQAGDPVKEKAATEAAEQWLKLIDDGDYNNGWKEASEYLRNTVTVEQFAKTILPIRAPLGKVISRKMKIRKYATSIPSGPDGEYVTIQFETTFENKKSAIETITPMLEKDGKWRTSGYYVK